MAMASWAQNSTYSASVAMIAGVFCPKKFVAISANNCTRLAAITYGGIDMENAASNAAAAVRAWLALSSAWAPAVPSQLTYGTTAATIATDVGPTQGPPVSSSITEL